MSAQPDAGGADHGLWTRLQQLPDRILFGEQAATPGAAGALRRAARYPYALIRDLLEGKLNLYAMGLVYATLFALIPLLAFSFGLLKVFHSQGLLEPLLHDFFSPMGSAADELTRRAMEFANRVRGGLLGSAGLALLIWTLVGAMKKVEDGFNFVWHVELPRNLARRMAEYLSLLSTGPLLLAAVIGLTRLAVNSAPVRELSGLPMLDRVAGLGLGIAPSIIASGLLTLLYVVIPNTHVRLGPALAGGITAGIMWAAIGRIFTLFVLYSSRLTVVYAGYAIIITALVWTYLNWMILLLGALVSFYAQNPAYLRSGLREPRVSGHDTERLALSIMYIVGERHRAGGERLTTSRLASELGYPGIVVTRLCRALERAAFLATAADETLLPARDLSQIRVADIIIISRRQSSGLGLRGGEIPSAVEQLCAQLEAAWQQRCADFTLNDLLLESTRGASP